MTTTSPPHPYDMFHAARARTALVASLYAEAMGDAYPAEIAASSSCDWHLMGLLTARLCLAPGQHLVDTGCGTGGIGLWLARALAARLDGIDISPVAVAQATQRRPHFLDPGRAAFRVADLKHTGLPDAHAHGIVCVDALGRAGDREAALRELGRVLAPGGRLAVTRALRHGTEPTWHDQIRAAGLLLEHIDERPDEPAMWQRLYELWIARADELHRALGPDPAEQMLHEARKILPTLDGRRAVLLTLRRPSGPADGAGPADRIPWTAPAERTSQ